MRIFIGFSFKSGDGTLRQVPVSYGDMSRQVAAIIRENSENKMPTVPKVACYITGIELDTPRLADSSFISKVNVRERRYTENDLGERTYQTVQGGNYTVERLMPTPFKLTMKADIWTSNTDQRLQLFEQIMVLFNPSLEIQTTDNYFDWTSLSVVNLTNIQWDTRNIPQGVDSEISVMSITFDMPIWITPPAKVKKLGIIQTIISNVFTESGSIVNIEDLVFNQTAGTVQFTTDDYDIVLLKSDNGQPFDYDVKIARPGRAIAALELSLGADDVLDWNTVLQISGRHSPNSRLYFKQPTGYELVGTYAINPIDPTILVVTFDQDTIPSNTNITSDYNPVGQTFIDRIVDPYNFNPLLNPNDRQPGVRFLMLDDVNPGGVNSDGPDAWKNLNGSDPIIKTNSIIEWNGAVWVEVFDPDHSQVPTYIQNLKTGIQYRWDGTQWIKSFEGEYSAGSWGFLGEVC